VLIDMEKALHVTDGTISLTSVGVKALCCSFDGVSFALLCWAGDLALPAAREPNLVIQGAIGFGSTAPSITPLVGGFSIILGGSNF
jgi:hypothetical protein